MISDLVLFFSLTTTRVHPKRSKALTVVAGDEIYFLSATPPIGLKRNLNSGKMRMVRVISSWIPSWVLLQALSRLEFVTSSESQSPVVIAGAGPASLVFAQRHLSNNPDAVIHIYERRPRPPRYSKHNGEEIIGDYAFGFGLTTRGMLALDRVGWKDTMMSISQKSSSGTYIVNRRDLVAEMIHKLERQFPPKRLRLKFEAKVTQLHSNGTLEVQDCRDGSCHQISDYSLLVAADGTNSCIRNNLVEMGKIKQTRFWNTMCWKALQLGPQPHMSSGGGASDLSTEMSFLVPRFQHRFVLLFCRFNCRDPTAQANPMNANSLEELKSAITTMFPNITNLPNDDVLKDFLETLPGTQCYMACDRHAIPEEKVALIGDAAVGTYAMFGHGSVSAMERALCLADCLSEHANDLKKALEEFSIISAREGRAISDLNLISHILRIKLLRQHGVKVRGKIAHYLVNEPDVPYSEIVRQPGIKWTMWLTKLVWRFVRIKPME
jgi:2-polyprenyl-6-methoxyphenol hydroxylase-like FAD-dependent oxidoreductase